MRGVIFALYGLGMYLLFVDVSNLGGSDNHHYLYFLYADLFLLLFITIHLVLSYVQKPKTGEDITGLHRFIPVSFNALALTWSVIITMFEQQLSDSAITYVIAIFATATLLLARASVVVILYALSLIVFIGAHRYVDGAGTAILKQYPFLIGLLIFGILISRITYRSFLNQFVAREKLLETRDELSQTNEELVETNRRLQETQLKLIRHEKLASIGQLAAGIAHEINNPLGYLKSNFSTFLRRLEVLKKSNEGTDTDRLERVKLYDEASQIIVDIREGLDRIAKVVQTLLDFSRPQSHDEIAPYDIHKGIETALNIAKNSYKYTASVERDFGDVPLIECRGGEINQIILNLLTNAAHEVSSVYSDGNTSGKIVIKTRTDGHVVTCDVSNNGRMIPDEHKEKIFEPFFTTKKSGEGSGLGLSISRHIATERHNGDLILLESGDSTTFRLVLPIKFDDIRSIK